MKKELTIKIIMIIAIILVVIGISLLSYGIYKKLTTKIPNPIATIEVENYGTIKVELYPDKAPNTVSNFITLANRGFYNDLTFHRVISGFMIQGGDKTGTGTGSPSLDDLKGNGNTATYAIQGEMIANGYTKNTVKMEKGVIAMAHSDYSSISASLTEESYNSAGSQFFIMQEDNASLDGLYTGFGKVIEGMEVVEAIANVEVTYKSAELAEGQETPKDENGKELTADMPINKPIIKSISVETYGINYGEPKTVEPFNYYNYLMQYYSSMSEQQ